jgi:hypothetical protein
MFYSCLLFIVGFTAWPGFAPIREGQMLEVSDTWRNLIAHYPGINLLKMFYLCLLFIDGSTPWPGFAPNRKGLILEVSDTWRYLIAHYINQPMTHPRAHRGTQDTWRIHENTD